MFPFFPKYTVEIVGLRERDSSRAARERVSLSAGSAGEVKS